MGTLGIYNYDKKSFNGVLFLLREPHNPEDFSVKSDEEKNKRHNEWSTDLLTSNGLGLVGTQRKYYNSYCYMLEHIGKDISELPLCSVANIHPLGGGEKTTKEYWNYFKEHKEERTSCILNEVHPKFIFTCNEIFYYIYDKAKNDNSIIEDCDFNNPNGLHYKSKNKNNFAFMYDNQKVEVYQIVHPSLGWKIYNN